MFGILLCSPPSTQETQSVAAAKIVLTIIRSIAISNDGDIDIVTVSNPVRQLAQQSVSIIFCINLNLTVLTMSNISVAEISRGQNFVDYSWQCRHVKRNFRALVGENQLRGERLGECH